MKSRRATIWQPHPVPRWRDLFGGTAARRKFLAYWKKDGLADTRDYLLFPLFGLAPAAWVSRLGGFIARRFAMPKFPGAVQRTRDNLGRIRPDLDAAVREAMVVRHFDNRGRVMAEFPVLTGLDAKGRIGASGEDVIHALHAQGRGVILIGLHLANWEIASAVLRRLGHPVRSFYQPPSRAAQHHIVCKVRESLMPGILLPPGVAGVRPALRLLQAGGVVVIFGDEELAGRVMAPFFGRTPHLNGNLAIAARMARMTGAGVAMFHCARDKDRYDLTFCGPVVLPSRADPRAPLLDDVMALNAAIEPLVSAHCDNWYFLDQSF